MVIDPLHNFVQRELFADRLLDEVAHSVMSQDRDILIEELIDLDLLTYCREALNRRGQ